MEGDAALIGVFATNAAAKGPSGELDALRSKAAEAKEALTVATNEASALRMQAMGVEAAAKFTRLRRARVRPCLRRVA